MIMHQHPLAIQPELPIADALLLIEWAQAEKPVSHLTFETDSGVFVVQLDDLKKMASMGLDKLPLDCIAIPAHSPLFGNRYHELSSTCDLSKQLSRFFPTYFVAALYEIQSLMMKSDVRGYVIGGIPRDLLLYQQKRFELTDVDITIEGNALEFAHVLVNASRNFTLLEEFPEFGTVSMRYKDNLMLDLASTRQEIYRYTGAMPEVIKRGVPLADDIIRRDFTINGLALSMHPLGEVLDYSHGIEDIEARLIRVLTPVSFYEDPSRILRALKFAVRFDFELAEETRFLVERFLAYGAMVYKGGGERIQYEFTSFVAARPERQETKDKWLRFFMENSCLQLANMELIRKPPETKIKKILDVARRLPKLLAELAEYIKPETEVRVYLCFLFAGLPEDEQEHTFHRLGLTRKQRQAIEEYILIAESQRFAKLKEFSTAIEIYQAFHGLQVSTVLAAILQLTYTEPDTTLSAESTESSVTSLLHDPESLSQRYKTLVEAFKTYKRKWERIHVELDGNDLLELGVPSGKPVGDTLKQILNAKLAGRVTDRVSEVRFVKELVKELYPLQKPDTKKSETD